MPKNRTLLESLPELEKEPWGEKVPAFAEWRFSCRNIYPETDNYSGFVYGKDTKKGIIYFSPYSLGDDNLSPNTSFPSIEISRLIKETIKVRRVLR